VYAASYAQSPTSATEKRPEHFAIPGVSWRLESTNPASFWLWHELQREGIRAASNEPISTQGGQIGQHGRQIATDRLYNDLFERPAGGR
jgi:hypothetical protein